MASFSSGADAGTDFALDSDLGLWLNAPFDFVSADLTSMESPASSASGYSPRTVPSNSLKEESVAVDMTAGLPPAVAAAMAAGVDDQLLRAIKAKAFADVLLASTGARDSPAQQSAAPAGAMFPSPPLGVPPPSLQSLFALPSILPLASQAILAAAAAAATNPGVAAPPIPPATTAPANIVAPATQPKSSRGSKAAAAAAAAAAATATPSALDMYGLEDELDKGEDGKNMTPEELDKRRRNTAASARFRARKKLREQALERNAKDMATKIETLEKKVKDYEMEIRWLRQLVTDRDGAKRLRDIYEENGLQLEAGNSETPQNTPLTMQEQQKMSALPTLLPRSFLQVPHQQPIMENTAKRVRLA